MNRKTLALCAVVMLTIAANAFAGAEGRIVAHVRDAITKQPIKDATAHMSAVEQRKFEEDYKVDGTGTLKVFVVDATIRYRLTVSAPGYAPYEETLKLPLGQTMNKDIFLKLQAAAPSDKAAQPKADPVVAAYNEGAQLFNDGKVVEAIAKFEEAVAGKPELIAGWEALARAQTRQKNWPKVIEAANKALEFVPDETDMWALLVEAYTATGDKVKAAEAKSKLPVDASTAYNEAVKFLNAYKDAEAEPLLKKAIAADEKFAPAHFQLGMVYLRANKMAESKAELQKYLELDPTGKDAETAKETLKYLK